jgi:probable HAF family extracellular repeat protein
MRRVVAFASVLLIVASALSAAEELMPEDLGVGGDTSLTPWWINQKGDVTGNAGRDVFLWPQTASTPSVLLSSGGFASPVAINDNGQVIGTDFGSQAQAFSWTLTGGVVRLSLGGSFSAVAAVNDSGQVTGASFLAPDVEGRIESHAFLWTPGADILDLGTLPGGVNSDADAVSNSGHVVGWSDVPVGADGFAHTTHAFLWSADTGMHDLGSLSGPAGTSFATAVNDSGQVVGYSSVPGDDSATHAFRWTAGLMQPLGTLGGPLSVATDLNSSGQVVGWSTDASGETRGFLWTETRSMVDLGAVRAEWFSDLKPLAINSNGQVIGERATGGAFVWTEERGMVALEPLPGFTRSRALRQNDSGEIVGISSNGIAWRATVWRRPMTRPTQLAAAGAGVYGESATLTAALTAAGSNVADKPVVFSLNGNAIASTATDVNGVATVTGVGIVGVNAGSYPGAVMVTFAGADGYRPSSAEGTLTVRKANQTISFTGVPSAEVAGNSFNVRANASSGLPVMLAAAGACSINGTVVTITTPTGVCSLMADQAGDANYSPAPQVIQTTAANYKFTGFFAPVQNVPAMNSASAGSALPVKFSLSGNQTLAVLDGTPASTPIACSSVPTAPAADPTPTTSSGLSYDSLTDQYLYVWKTDKAWAETCRQLVFKLADGTVHRAYFNFVK